jgi:ABC-type Na+ transport system ATPase subunit NatA
MDEDASQECFLTGPNGTGKTTILEMIVWLWDKFHDYIMGIEGENRVFPGNMYQAELFAVELRDLLGKTLWLYKVNGAKQADSFVAELADDNAAFVGEILGEVIQTFPVQNDKGLPFVFSFKGSDNFQGTRSEIHIVLEKLTLAGCRTRAL